MRHREKGFLPSQDHFFFSSYEYLHTISEQVIDGREYE